MNIYPECVFFSIYFSNLFQNKEVKVLREDTVALNNLKNEYNRLVSSQSESKVTAGRIAELEAQVAELMEKLRQEKALREEIEEERERIKQDKDQVSGDRIENKARQRTGEWRENRE